MSETRLGACMDEICKTYPGAIWGACRMNFSQYAGKYKYAVVIVMPYGKLLLIDKHKEADFYEYYTKNWVAMEEMGDYVQYTLDLAGIDCYLPKVRTDFDEHLSANINNKDLARRAGLGWIGKNNLLVCPDAYGPRLGMVSFLTDEEIEVGTPVEEEFCGECEECVRKCLFHVLKNVPWDHGVTREEQVDYRKCHDGRMAAKRTLHHKMGCGRCMMACPVGTDRWDSGRWDAWKKEHGVQKRGV